MRSIVSIAATIPGFICERTFPTRMPSRSDTQKYNLISILSRGGRNRIGGKSSTKIEYRMANIRSEPISVPVQYAT
jgi:hypothetical protein